MSKVRTQVMLDLDVFNSIIRIQEDLKVDNISQAINKFIKQTIIAANDRLELQNVYKWRLDQKDKIIEDLKIQISNLKIQLQDLKEKEKAAEKEKEKEVSNEKIKKSKHKKTD